MSSDDNFEREENDKKHLWDKMMGKLPENGPSPRGFMVILMIMLLFGYFMYQKHADGKPEGPVKGETVVLRELPPCQQPDSALELKLEGMKDDYKKMDAQFYEFEQKLNEESAAIDAERKNYSIGDLPPALMDRITKHNANIKSFNEIMVPEKNRRDKDLKDLVLTFNTQVDQYNVCLDKNR